MRTPRTRRPKANTGFTGFGRSPTDADGVVPFHHGEARPRARARRRDAGAAHQRDGVRARHADAPDHRGSISPTRPSTAHDPVLALVPDDAGRQTLIARQVAGGGETTYRFDIRLQGDANGEGETVFFEC